MLISLSRLRSAVAVSLRNYVPRCLRCETSSLSTLVKTRQLLLLHWFTRHKWKQLKGVLFWRLPVCVSTSTLAFHASGAVIRNVHSFVIAS